MGQVVDIRVHVPDASTARVQEVQLIQLHVVCELVERRLAGGAA